MRNLLSGFLHLQQELSCNIIVFTIYIIKGDLVRRVEHGTKNSLVQGTIIHETQNWLYHIDAENFLLPVLGRWLPSERPSLPQDL